MQTIIGLGQAGCNIADKFAEYPQYKVYKIDAGLEKAPRCFNFPKYDNPEKYEENCTNVKDFFKNVKDYNSISEEMVKTYAPNVVEGTTKLSNWAKNL